MNALLRECLSGKGLRAQAEEIICRMQREDSNPVWILKAQAEEIYKQVVEIERRKSTGEILPLYGQFFAVKDNIDVKGVPTTAGCPAYSFVPEIDAFVVRKAIEAGAVFVGKTNMDQFATGLVGTRSPHGACRNAVHPDYISGGSSSGSAVAVAQKMATFSFGTDTAGSGRVPAAFNGLVGYKPTRGLLSTSGVVPACRSLDCVSIFASNVADARTVADSVKGVDASDPYSRKAIVSAPDVKSGSFRFGVPSRLEFFGDTEAARLYDEAVVEVIAMGGEKVEIDFKPFAQAAQLLYQGPWVAERYASVGEWMEKHAAVCDPIVSEIILKAQPLKAVDAFKAMYRLEELRRETEELWKSMDVLLLPTAPTVYRISEIEENPVELNSRLGTYTNFVNLLDLCALALPFGEWSFGVPFGVTFMAPAFRDGMLFDLGSRFLDEEVSTGTKATSAGMVRLAVLGAHLKGQPLHHQLTDLQARFITLTRTSPDYRFYALSESRPAKPGMVRAEAGGASIEVEVYELSEAAFGTFVAGIPAPLGIGTVQLQDGSWVKGFLCEPYAVKNAEEITQLGAWRAYLEGASKA